ncbi:hypothetical protein L6164_004146 [Bauhinia variegata]|uniref:Uncharacterized protein n=1 Tax=Bauhinia variegata TaxID=167791 RepID=A0ACB9Q475_BAUVA|nr:hypothetical protein L6164_004146 [Bauhinia variegata]
MAKCPIRPLLLLSKKSYVVTAENVRLQPAAVVTKVVGSSDSTESVVSGDEKNFWMRDPKTGNWIPEKHFGEVNVADLREKLLSKTQK